MSLAYFPFYPADFEADTSHLTLEEDGAYNRLLRLCWMTPGCSLPDDPAWIARRMRVDMATFERVVAPLLAEFFRRGKGRVDSPRLTAIHDETDEKHRRRVEAGKKGGRPPKALKTPEPSQSNAKAMPKQPEPEPEPVREEGKPSSSARGRTEPRGFSAFWDAYPHRGGMKKGRKPSLDAYRRAMERGAGEAAILAGARAAHGDPQVQRGYARDPTTWLNQAGWEDEFGPPNIIGFPPAPPSGPRNRSNERLAAWLDAARDAPEPGMAGGSDRDPPQALLRG